MFGLSIKAVVVEVLLFLCYDGIVAVGVILNRCGRLRSILGNRGYCPGWMA